MSDWAKFAIAGALVVVLGAWGIHGGGLAGSSSAEIEQRLFRDVARSLSSAPDNRWAVFDVDGQTVRISGTAPSPEHILRAEEAARAAAWSGGPLVGGVMRVSSKGAAPWMPREGAYVFRAELNLNRLSLVGAAPSRDVADALETFAGALFADRRVEAALAIDESPPESGWDGWEEAARGALIVLSHYELGEAELADYQLTVNGDVKSPEDRAAARKRLGRTLSALSRVEARVLRPPAQAAAPTPSIPAPAPRDDAPEPPVEDVAALEPGSAPELGPETQLAEAAPVRTPRQTEGPAGDCQSRFDAALGDARIHFDLNSAVVSEESNALLESIAAIAAECAPFSLRIEGHTDDTGVVQLNRSLAVRRAQTVLDRLVDAGVDPARLSAVGFGATRPMADNDTEEGRRANRRIEIIVVP
ncbi:MAG: OmpA family protein [Maricaulaceae bacterium]|jgi:outer membrane protein OmpA-like peptidoglycan-associated protein